MDGWVDGRRRDNNFTLENRSRVGVGDGFICCIVIDEKAKADYEL
jgi:hypothetical protein